MSSVGIQLREESNAAEIIYGVVSHAIKIHKETESCEFEEGAEVTISDKVFNFMVDEVEKAETKCRLHADE
jgi:hypothetical protein